MDIFYYWKDYDADVKAGRIGWLAVSRKKLTELRDRHPDWIWAFRQPKNRKGELQLLARLRWADAPVARLPIEKGTPVLYYDPAQSVCFPDADDAVKVAEITSILRIKFPHAFMAGFRGDAGVQPMEVDLLAQFRAKVAAFTTAPFPGVPQPAAT